MLSVDMMSPHLGIYVLVLVLLPVVVMSFLQRKTIKNLRFEVEMARSKCLELEAKCSEFFEVNEEVKDILIKACHLAKDEGDKILERARFKASLVISASNSYCVNAHIELNDRLRFVRKLEHDSVTLAEYVDARSCELLESTSNQCDELLAASLKQIESVERSAVLKIDRLAEQGLNSIEDTEAEIARQLHRLSEIKEVERVCAERIQGLQESVSILEAKNSSLANDISISELDLSQKEGQLAVVQNFLDSKERLESEVIALEKKVCGYREMCESERNRYEQAAEELVSKYGYSVEMLTAESNISDLKDSYLKKKVVYDELISEIANCEVISDLQDSGLYASIFNFADSNKFREELELVREQQKELVKDKAAVICYTNWTVNDSVAQGRVMTNKAVKLTLRAFNGACDAAIRGVKWNNANLMMARVEKEREQITKLNSSNNIYITDEYYDLKLKELRLTHEHRERLKEEKDERQELSRALREEQKLLRDMELAEQEELKYKNLLDKALAEAADLQGVRLEAYQEKIKVLQASLEEAHAKYVRAQSMAEMTKSGWVYIVSNIGSFGPDIVKIGLTRRLDPTDRVRELGAAGVPFVFDTHALIYSDNAPALERSLHFEFAAKRVNTVNLRKEFFKVSLAEVKEAVMRLAPDSPFIEDIEAQDYQQTRIMREALLRQDMVSVASPFPSTI